MYAESTISNEKKLFLSSDPLIQSYSYHSDFFHVTRNDSLFNQWDAEASNIKFSFEQYNKESPKISQKNCKVYVTEGKTGIKLRLEQETEDDRSCFYSYQVMGDGSFELTVDFIKLASHKSVIGIRFYNQETDTSYTVCYCGHSSIMILTEEQGDVSRRRILQSKMHTKLMGAVKNGQLTFFYSEDETGWEQVSEEISFEVSDYQVGIYVEQGYDDFRDWLAVNYIQLSYDPYKQMGYRLDFFTGIQCSTYKNYVVNPFLKTYTYNLEVVRKYMKVSELLMKVITDDYYVHANIAGKDVLLYGFSLEEEVFYIVQYNLGEEHQLTTLPFDFEEHVSMEEECILFKMFFDDDFEERFPFRKNVLIQFIDDYLNGRNSYGSMWKVPGRDDRIYGLNIYDMLIEQIKNKVYETHSFFVLGEHKKIMKMRLQYLYHSGYIDKTSLKMQIKVFDKIEEDLKVVYQISRKEDKSESDNTLIRNSLLNAKEAEKEALSLLLSILK